MKDAIDTSDEEEQKKEQNKKNVAFISGGETLKFKVREIKREPSKPIIEENGENTLKGEKLNNNFFGEKQQSIENNDEKNNEEKEENIGNIQKKRGKYD